MSHQDGGESGTNPTSHRWEWRASWAQCAAVWVNEIFVLSLAAGAVAGCVYLFRIEQSALSVVGAVLAAAFGLWCIWTLPRTARAAPLVVRASADRLTVRYPRRCISMKRSQVEDISLVVSTQDARVRLLQVQPPASSPPVRFTHSYMGEAVHELAEVVRDRVDARLLTTVPRTMTGVRAAADNAPRRPTAPMVLGIPPRWVAFLGLFVLAVAIFVWGSESKGWPLPRDTAAVAAWPVGVVLMLAFAYTAVALVQRKVRSAAFAAVGVLATGAALCLLL